MHRASNRKIFLRSQNGKAHTCVSPEASCRTRLPAENALLMKPDDSRARHIFHTHTQNDTAQPTKFIERLVLDFLALLQPLAPPPPSCLGVAARRPPVGRPPAAPGPPANLCAVVLCFFSGGGTNRGQSAAYKPTKSKTKIGVNFNIYKT